MMMASRSKSCQKVKESSKVEKSQRFKKSAKAINSEKASFLIFNTKLAFTLGSSRTHNKGLSVIV